MSDVLANDFSDILNVLSQNDVLRTAVLALIANEPVSGKVTEGGDRLEQFRIILTDLVDGKIDLNGAIRRTQMELRQQSSPYSANNRVFPANWDERLVRTQVSRFYNQAVMEHLLATGETQCLVPHSPTEEPTSKCSMQLAGRTHDLRLLYDRLIESYRNGNWSQAAKIPDHPYCTHVVTRAK